jgi:hypothetical protein
MLLQHRVEVVLCATFVLLSMPILLWAHGLAGKRFFPPH